MMTRRGLSLAVVVSLFLVGACGKPPERSPVPTPPQVTSAPTPTQTVSDGCEVGKRIAADMPSCKWGFIEAWVDQDLRLHVTTNCQVEPVSYSGFRMTIWDSRNGQTSLAHPMPLPDPKPQPMQG